MHQNEKVTALFEDAEQKNNDESIKSDRLIAERDTSLSPGIEGKTGIEGKKKSSNRFLKVIGGFLLLSLIVVGGAGYLVTRNTFDQGQTIQSITAQMANIDGRVAGLTSGASDEHSRIDTTFAELRKTDEAIKKSLDEMSSEISHLRGIADKNSSAIQTLDAKLEAAKEAARKSRANATKIAPKQPEVADQSPDPKFVFPDFSLVSIDTFALQYFAVVRSPGKGLVDMGLADTLDGWRVVEFDIAGQRVAFESRTGVLRWLTAQP